MIIKVKIGPWLFKGLIAYTERVAGYNSTLRNGDHILMWDFDDLPLEDVVVEIGQIIQYFRLPCAEIFDTGKSNHWHVVIRKRVPWWLARHIVAAAEHVDKSFFLYGIWRNYFTLRFSAKNGRQPRLVMVVPGCTEPDVSWDEICSFDEYVTQRGKRKHKVISVPKWLEIER